MYVYILGSVHPPAQKKSCLKKSRSHQKLPTCFFSACNSLPAQKNL